MTRIDGTTLSVSSKLGDEHFTLQSIGGITSLPYRGGGSRWERSASSISMGAAFLDIFSGAIVYTFDADKFQNALKVQTHFFWDMLVCASQSPKSDLLRTLSPYRNAGMSSIALNVADAGRTLEHAIRTISHYRSQIAKYSEELLLVETPSDIEEAARSERMGLFFNVEGALSLGEQIDLVRVYYDLGVRWMALAYNRKNAFGFGCHDDVDEGLSALGVELVDAMDAVGMIKCCSHAGYRTALEVFERNTRPCIFSHSNPLKLAKHRRNVPDELIKAVARTDGVIGITGVNVFMGTVQPTVDDMFAQIDYVVNLVGETHVGIGLDYGVSDLKEESADGPGRSRR